MRFLVLVVVLVVVAGCSDGSGAGQSSGTATPTATPDVAPPTASPEPTIDVALAAELTLAALDEYNEAYETNGTKYKLRTVDSCRNYAKAMLKAERTLAAAIGAIVYPPAVQKHADKMLEWGAELQIVLRTAAKAKTITSWNKIMEPANRIDRKAAAAATLLRAELGLPARG